MAATLEKIRIPRTTITPVDSWPPTPSLSPRKTMPERDHDVAHERDHEDLVVEDPVEVGAQAAEDRVESGDHRDRQVRVEGQGYVGAQHQPEHDADDEPQHGDHGEVLLVVGATAPLPGVPQPQLRVGRRREERARSHSAGRPRTRTGRPAPGTPRRSCWPAARAGQGVVADRRDDVRRRERRSGSPGPRCWSSRSREMALSRRPLIAIASAPARHSPLTRSRRSVARTRPSELPSGLSETVIRSPGPLHGHEAGAELEGAQLRPSPRRAGPGPASWSTAGRRSAGAATSIRSRREADLLLTLVDPVDQRVAAGLLDVGVARGLHGRERDQQPEQRGRHRGPSQPGALRGRRRAARRHAAGPRARSPRRPPRG